MDFRKQIFDAGNGANMSPAPKRQLAYNAEIIEFKVFDIIFSLIFSENPAHFQRRGGASPVHFGAKLAYRLQLTGDQRSK